MGIDWGLALQIGGAGFGMVFALLIILAFAVWITGRLVNRKQAAPDTEDQTKKGT